MTTELPDGVENRVVENRVVGFDDAFERLFMRAYKVSFQILRSQEDAEDVAMDTMARALSNWHKLEAPVDAWVVRVAANRSFDLWRRSQRQRQHDLSLRLEQSVRQGHGEEGLDLRQAVARLPKRQREVVVLRYFLDLSEHEIAATLGCSTGSVKQHATRGLMALRKALGTTSPDVLRDA